MRPHQGARIGPLARLAARLESLAEAERDQLPLWLPVGLILGISAYFYLPDQEAWIAFLLFAGSIVCFGLAFGATRWGRALALFSVAAALGCGLVWWKAEQATAPRLAPEQLMEIDARVESVQSLAAMQFNFVVASNEGAVRLWESLGFETVGRLPGAFRHPRLGESDALVMYRRL